MIVKIEDHETWIKERMNGIGGSESGSVLGLNPWCSNVQLWRYKTGKEVPPDISDKPAVQFGKVAEEHIRELFRLDYPKYSLDYHAYWIYRNDAYQWQFATLDGELTDEAGRRGILEIKTTTIQNKRQWDEWEEGIPQRYYAQILHQLSATGWDFAILRAYIRYYKGGEFRAAVRDYRIERKDVSEDIAVLCDAESRFMECVKLGKPPAVIFTM